MLVLQLDPRIGQDSIKYSLNQFRLQTKLYQVLVVRQDLVCVEIGVMMFLVDLIVYEDEDDDPLVTKQQTLND